MSWIEHAASRREEKVQTNTTTGMGPCKEKQLEWGRYSMVGTVVGFSHASPSYLSRVSSFVSLPRVVFLPATLVHLRV